MLGASTKVLVLAAVVLSSTACPRTATNDASSAEPVPTKEPTVSEERPTSDTWSPVVDGLQIRAVPPSGPAEPGSVLTITLELRNTGPELRRIYLLESEPFRAMQSTFFLELPEPTALSMQPEPRPHGIVVTEVDFHELPPGKTKRFTQSLRLPDDVAPGTLFVRWEYSNRVDRWEGGVQTFDGPTKELFGGGPIPGIWIGEVETRFDVVVGKP
jgi:hypothetical protein